jgi:hypothetical protein
MDHLPESSLPPQNVGRLERFVSIDSKPFEQEANEVAAFYALLANQERCRLAIKSFGGTLESRAGFERENSLPPGAFELMVFNNDPEVRETIDAANKELAASNREEADLSKFLVRLEDLSVLLASRYPAAASLLTRLTGNATESGLKAWKILNKNSSLPPKFYASLEAYVATGIGGIVLASVIAGGDTTSLGFSVRVSGPPKLAS